MGVIDLACFGVDILVYLYVLRESEEVHERSVYSLLIIRIRNATHIICTISLGWYYKGGLSIKCVVALVWKLGKRGLKLESGADGLHGDGWALLGEVVECFGGRFGGGCD